MKVIKRNSQEVVFDANKIRIAVGKANNSMDEPSKRLSDAQIEKIADQDIAYPTFTAIDWSKNGYNWLASLTSDALAGSYVEFTNVKFQSVFNDGDQDLYSKFVLVTVNLFPFKSPLITVQG